jgi:hypothetical protein
MVTLRNPWLKKCARAASTIRCRIDDFFCLLGPGMFGLFTTLSQSLAQLWKLIQYI